MYLFNNFHIYFNVIKFGIMSKFIDYLTLTACLLEQKVQLDNSKVNRSFVLSSRSKLIIIKKNRRNFY